MTLSGSFDDQLPASTDIFDGSSSTWDALYCSHLWSNSNLRRAIINSSHTDNKVIKYCYTCKGKIRKYEIKSPITISSFDPNNHSTPNRTALNDIELPISKHHNYLHDVEHETPNYIFNSIKEEVEPAVVEPNQCIPSISQQIDSSLRQKYTSYEMRPNEINRRRLRKSLKGIGCIVNLALTDSPVKKRTQIQACSISVMILAIVVISFILVNFTTPSFTRATSVVSTIVVPTQSIDFNETSSAITRVDSDAAVTTTYISTTEYTTELSSIIKQATLISNIITKIRKNIKTYPKYSKKIQESQKPKDINNRDLSQRFCSCQTNEVCMLDENTGTAICKQAVDIEDPTGKLIK